MKKSLFLCPGAHKTGTTLLQSSLEVNREILQNQGFFPIRRQQFYKSNFWKYIKQDDNEDKDQITLEQATKSLNILCEAQTNRHIILSIENIFGEFGIQPYSRISKTINNLQSLFPNHEVKVIYYIRRQDTYIESMYLQYIHKCQNIKFHDFYSQYKDANLSWLEILDEISKIINTKSIKVFTYESLKSGSKEFITNFFKELSLSLIDNLNFENPAFQGKYTNRSLSNKGLKVALSSFPHLTMDERKVLIKFLQKNFGNDKYPSFKSLNSEQRSYILSKYLESNKRLFLKYLTDFNPTYYTQNT